MAKSLNKFRPLKKVTVKLYFTVTCYSKQDKPRVKNKTNEAQTCHKELQIKSLKTILWFIINEIFISL